MFRGRPSLEGQLAHAILLGVLIVGVQAATALPGVAEGELWGLSTITWLWLSVASAVAHQVWVAVCWRAELHHGGLSARLGPAGFRLYAAGFALLSAARFATLIPLSVANAGTVDAPSGVSIGAGVACILLGTWVMVSVARYFSFRRALGVDHFDASMRTVPFVRRGVFRWTPNAMYVLGFALVWAPGFLSESKAGLLAAAFMHAYIWVHYWCTERPDMVRIYARLP